MPTQLWKRHLGARRAPRRGTPLPIRGALGLLLATLLVPAAADAGGSPPADQIWSLTIVSMIIGPPSLDSQIPPGVPCLPCHIDEVVGGGLAMVIDVGDSGPVDAGVVLTGLYLGVGNLTYVFDHSREPKLLTDYEQGAVAFLVIEDPPPGLETGRITLRYTLLRDGHPHWTEQEVLRK